MNLVFLDTETSGLYSHIGDRVCQLSYIITNEELSIIDSKNFYFSVDSVDYGASSVHGLTVDVLKELSKNRSFEDFAEEIYKDLNNSKIVCHNTEFDLGFIDEEFKRINKEIEYSKVFCTMCAYTNILQIPHPYYYYKFPKLEEVVDYLNISSAEINSILESSFKESDSFHDARYDVVCTYLIYKKYLKIEEERDKEILDSLSYGEEDIMPF